MLYEHFHIYFHPSTDFLLLARGRRCGQNTFTSIYIYIIYLFNYLSYHYDERQPYKRVLGLSMTVLHVFGVFLEKVATKISMYRNFSCQNVQLISLMNADTAHFEV